MKRSIAAVTAAVCLFFASSAFALTVEEEVALLKEEVSKMKSGSLSEALGIETNIGATFVLQGVSKANDGSDAGRIDGSLSVDLEFGKKFENGGNVFFHLEGAIGEGLNDKLSLYSPLNGDAGTTVSIFTIAEFWYEQALFDDKLTLTFGRMDPTAYFDGNAVANDETEQFLASMFVNNSAIAFPDYSLGLRATYSPFEFLDLTYAYFNQDSFEFNNIDTNGFNIIEAGFKLGETGNYRLLYWTNAAGIPDLKGERIQDYGIGASLDQAVNENITLFARFGYRNPDADTAEVDEDDNGDPIVTGYAPYITWSFGAQFNGALWGRENDALGVAAGQNIISEDLAKLYGSKSDAETQTELYYKFALTENVALTPVLQYVIAPSGGNATDDDIFTFGIRTQISF
ncbi:MAG: carbohydrate porin [Endomicrobium sp.]|jgi:carbohydrate-selective porin OprB|nr:carbohydrate porin [Endomicrobium sp.]